MSQNWHNFFFGAFDPWGTVSVDKLPGAFWVQALSVRVFGFHVWAFVLPQVVEGTLTVLVLYRAVRRVAGAGAGLLAAVALAVTPVTILLNRGNISDSLLILLLVLAADAATNAFMSGRLRPLVLAGLWVGLAFQAKMLQAWLVLPALYIAYLMAAPALSLARRYGHVAVSAAVALAVSLSWMTIVALVPAHDRPYVDGSCNNSVFSQVFLYNGADRLNGKVLEQPGCTPPPSRDQASTVGGAPTVPLEQGPGADTSPVQLGRDAAWLFIPAMVALVGILVARRRRPRTDPWRAAAVLWGFWMILTWAFFADSKFLNAYYLAALGATDGGALRARPRPRLEDLAHEPRKPRGSRRLRRDRSRRCRRGAVPRPAQRRRMAVGPGNDHRPHRARHVCLAICLLRTATDVEVAHPRRPRAGRRRTPHRGGVGVGHRRRQQARAVRLALSVAGADRRPNKPGGSTTCDLAGAGRGMPRPSRRDAASRQWRHRPRSARTSWPPATSIFPWAASPARCRARRCRSSSKDVHDGRINRVLVAGPTAHPQSGPALGPESLQPGARGRHLVQGARRATSASRPTPQPQSHSAPPRTDQNGQSVSPSDVEEAPNGDGRADRPDQPADDDHHHVGHDHLRGRRSESS